MSVYVSLSVSNVSRTMSICQFLLSVCLSTKTCPSLLSVCLSGKPVRLYCLSVCLGKPVRLYCLSVCLRLNISPSSPGSLHPPPCRFSCVSLFVRPSVSVGQSVCVSVRLAGYLHIHCLVLVPLSVRPSVRLFPSVCLSPRVPHSRPPYPPLPPAPPPSSQPFLTGEVSFWRRTTIITKRL